MGVGAVGMDSQPLSVSRWRSRKNRGASSSLAFSQNSGGGGGRSAAPQSPEKAVSSSVRWQPDASAAHAAAYEAAYESHATQDHDQGGFDATHEIEFDNNYYPPSPAVSPLKGGPAADFTSSAFAPPSPENCMKVQHDRAVDEIQKLQSQVRDLTIERDLMTENKDQEKKVIKKQREDLVEAELFNLQQVQQLEFEKAKNSADKWQASADWDELVKFRKEATNYRRGSSKQAELKATKAKVTDLHQTLSKHEEKALEYQKKCYELTTQNAMLRASTQAPDWSSSYGERCYEVMVEEVKYRFTAELSNLNDAEAGPALGDIIVGIGLLQGPRVIYVKCKSGRGFLPIMDNTGKELLQHKGKVGEPFLDHTGEEPCWEAAAGAGEAAPESEEADNKMTIDGDWELVGDTDGFGDVTTISGENGKMMAAGVEIGNYTFKELDDVVKGFKGECKCGLIDGGDVEGKLSESGDELELTVSKAIISMTVKLKRKVEVDSCEDER